MAETKLGEYVKNMRQKQGLSYQQIVDKSDNEVSISYIRHIEISRIKSPSPHILYALSKAFDCEYLKLMKMAGYMVTERKGK